MSDLKRLAVKYVRDLAKSSYKKGDYCEICGSKTDLEFHHYYSMTALLEKWILQKGYKEEDIISVREEFIAEHTTHIYEDTVTLCKTCHKKLHKIYGIKPNLGTGEKQKRWVERMSNK